MVATVGVSSEIAQPNIEAAFGQREGQITIVLIIHITANTVYHPTGARVWEAMLKQNRRFVCCFVVWIYLGSQKNIENRFEA